MRAPFARTQAAAMIPIENACAPLEVVEHRLVAVVPRRGEQRVEVAPAQPDTAVRLAVLMQREERLGVGFSRACNCRYDFCRGPSSARRRASGATPSARSVARTSTPASASNGWSSGPTSASRSPIGVVSYGCKVTVRRTILPLGSEFGDRPRPPWRTEGSGPSTKHAAS